MTATNDGQIIETHFRSLQECIDHIDSNYGPEKRIVVQGRDIDSGESIAVQNAPAYLYRGESHYFVTTVTSMQRLTSEDGLPDNVKSIIEEVTSHVNVELQEILTPISNSPILSEGFCQHYGLPTKLIDVTSGLEVAAYFASGGTIGETGCICVFPVGVVSRNSKVIDLTEHSYATRAREQSAFVIHNDHHTDFKSAACIQTLDLKWFSFTLTNEDVNKYHVGKNNLLDVRADMMAGMLQFILDNMPKMNDRAAKWLSENVVPAPMTVEVESWHGPNQPDRVKLTPLSETSIKYDEKQARLDNYINWSENFAETRSHRLTAILGETLRSIFPSVEILSELETNWPAGRSLDHLVPSHKLAFLYWDGETPDNRKEEAAQWCHDNGYRLVVAKGPDVTENAVRLLI